MTVQADEYLAGQAIAAGNYEEAVRLLRPLAERNSAYALLTLGWIYETDATGTPDKNAALAFYKDAAAQGSATAYLYLGWFLQSAGEEIEARAAFERGAQLNDDECKSVLVRLANNADEKLAAKALEEEAYEEAVRLLQPLAERNSAYALLCLGSIYERGVTGAPDNEAARSYYERAAAQGRADAYCALGLLLSGQGEDAQARAAFEGGAERGHAESMSRLGWIIVKGRGGPTDLDAGSAWLEKAAAKGHTFARIHLLVIEEGKARSILRKLAIRMKRVPLVIRWIRERSRNASSKT
jgi:TPR repeat protein